MAGRGRGAGAAGQAVPAAVGALGIGPGEPGSFVYLRSGPLSPHSNTIAHRSIQIGSSFILTSTSLSDTSLMKPPPVGQRLRHHHLLPHSRLLHPHLPPAAASAPSCPEQQRQRTWPPLLPLSVIMWRWTRVTRMSWILHNRVGSCRRICGCSRGTWRTAELSPASEPGCRCMWEKGRLLQRLLHAPTGGNPWLMGS